MAEKLMVDQLDLYKTICGDHDTDFEKMEDTITSSDDEDGGANHRAIIRDKSTGKFYEMEYSDWDIYHNFEYNRHTGVVERCDFNCELDEVIPVQITITKYIPKP